MLRGCCGDAAGMRVAYAAGRGAWMASALCRKKSPQPGKTPAEWEKHEANHLLPLLFDFFSSLV